MKSLSVSVVILRLYKTITGDSHWSQNSSLKDYFEPVEKWRG